MLPSTDGIASSAIIRLLVRPIREYDADGNLIAAGVEWSEHRAWLLQLSMPVMVPAMLTWMASTVKSLSNHATNTSVTAAIISGIIYFGGLWLLIGGVPRKRSLLFRRDGAIDAPQGLPGLPQYVVDQIGLFDQKKISSIEIGDDPKHGIDVRLYSSDGDKLVVGYHFFEPDFAHKVAVMLQNALHDIRRGYTDELEAQFVEMDRKFHHAASGARAGDTINVTID